MKKIENIINNIDKLKKEKQPEWIDPMLAVLTHDTFSRDGWIFERKLDGERCIVHKKGNSVKLFSRNKKNLNDTYPEIYESFKNQSGSFIVDGEIVAFDGKVTSFQKLQERMQIKNKVEAQESDVKVFYYAFDIMSAGSYKLVKLPLSDRKKILKESLNSSDHIRLTLYRKKNGDKFYNEACRKKWEGLIAKDFTGSYVSSRSKKWFKFKCINRQEFVIGGYTEPDGERIGFGALLVGYHENGALKYAGKVGTGYDDKTLNSLHKKLSEIKTNKNPFSNKEIDSSNTHWVKPKLLAEIGFTEWTRENRLRHPRYIGLRNDKKPSDVKREG